MKVDIYTHPEFEPEFKRLCKKYHSLIDDYAQLLDDLEKSPFQGTSLAWVRGKYAWEWTPRVEEKAVECV